MIPSAVLMLLLAYPPVVAFGIALYLLFPACTPSMVVIAGLVFLTFPAIVMVVCGLLTHLIGLKEPPSTLGVSALLFGVCFAQDPVRGVDVLVHSLTIVAGSGGVVEIAVIGSLVGQCFALATATYVLVAVAMLTTELPCRWFFSAGDAEVLVPWSTVRLLLIVLLFSLGGAWIFEEIFRAHNVLFSIGS